MNNQLNIDNELDFPSEENEFGIRFTDLFILEDIQRMQDLFSDATGIASVITYPDGTPITAPSNFCRFCQIVRNTEKGLANCIKSDTLSYSCLSPGMQLQPCLSAGLWDTGAKISVNGIHIANWLIGQVRNEEINLQKVIDYGNEIGANKKEYLKALQQVPVMSVAKLQKIFEMMFVIANDLSEKAYSNLQLNRQIKESKKINELLHKSEESLSITLQSIGDGVISTDISGSVINMNSTAENMCGWKLSEACGKQLSEVFKIINADTRKFVENPVKNVLENGKTVGLANHTLLLSKSGKEYHIADSAAPIKNMEGVITGVVLVFSDVTEKYLVEKQLRESERSKSVLLSNLPGMAYRCKYDRQWTMEFVSEGFSTLTGYDKDDIIGNHTISFNDLILPEYHDFLWKEWERAVQNHEACQIEYRILTADHTEKWVWEQGIPIYNNSGEVEALEGLIMDITERKNIETALQNERLLLRTLIDNIPYTIYAKDMEGRKILANKAEVQLLGATIENEVLGRGDFEFYPKEFAENFHRDDQQVIQTGIPEFNREGFIIDGKGEKHWLLSSKLPLRDKDDQIIGVMGIGRDITARRQTEEALKKSENFLKETQIIAQLGTYSLDILSGKWTSSEVLDSIFGIASDFDKSFDGWTSIIHPEWQNIIRNYVLNSVIGEKMKFDKKYKIIRLYDKEERWVHGLGELVFDNENRPISLIGTIHDITNQVKDEEALRTNEAKYRTIFENIQDVFYQVDIDGTFLNVSPSIKQLVGYDRDEIIGSSIQKLYAQVDDRQKALDNILKNNQVTDYEIDLKTKTGVIVPSSLNARLICDSLGKPDHIDGFIRDITYRKQAEVELRENEEFLKTTQLIANLGNCMIDITSNTWRSSEVLDSIVGISPDFDKTFKGITSIIHPEWKNTVCAYFMHDVLVNRTKFNKKFKIIRSVNQDERWVHAIGELKLDQYNNPVKLIVTVQDITERKLTSETLRHSEALHRSILTASPNAIVVMEMDGRLTIVSPAALSLYGCKSPDLLLGRNMFEFIVPEDRERALSNSLLMFNGYTGAIEYRILRENGTMFFAEVSGDIIWGLDHQPESMVFIIRDITDRKKTEEALKSSQIELKEFASHLQNIREEEKIQLAREIHDELGQILIALKIDLGMLKQKVLKSIKAVNAENILTNFDSLFGLVDNTLNTTRKIMTDLRPEVLYLIGFVEAVKLYVNNFRERYQIVCSFENSIPQLNLNSQQSVALYRIMQESLTNIAKHAKATNVKIELGIKENKLIMKVNDNGIGFKTSKKNKPNSYGLLGMKERVYLLEGELSISSQPGEGTTIKVEIPYLN